ncbi:hypothetical protein D9M69_708190 [compost metagenome]
MLETNAASVGPEQDSVRTIVLKQRTKAEELYASIGRGHVCEGLLGLDQAVAAGLGA